MNKKEEIKKLLTEWFNTMLAKYTWLKVKYEYNEAKECYLVSFYISSGIENLDFDKDVLEFEEAMDNKYGDSSPLFCDNEELFKLSSGAKILYSKSKNIFEELIGKDRLVYLNITSPLIKESPQFREENRLKESYVKLNDVVWMQ